MTRRWFPYRITFKGTRPGVYYARTEDGQKPAGPSDAQVVRSDNGEWEATIEDGHTVVYRGTDLRAALRTAESAVNYEQEREAI